MNVPAAKRTFYGWVFFAGFSVGFVVGMLVFAPPSGM
jgi:hypothetical protein